MINGRVAAILQHAQRFYRYKISLHGKRDKLLFGEYKFVILS